MLIHLSDDQIRAEWKRLRAAKGRYLGHISVGTIEVEPGVTVSALIEVVSGDEANQASHTCVDGFATAPRAPELFIPSGGALDPRRPR